VILNAIRQIWFSLLGLLALVGSGISPATRLEAAVNDVAARFPQPEQVLADFSDDAERYAAFKTLHGALQQALPGPPPAVASGKVAAYYNALMDVDFQRRQSAASQADYERYTSRIRELLGDPKFRERVLARYQLGNSPNSREEDELDVALRRSVPYWIATLLALVVLAPVFVFALDRRRLRGAAHASPAGAPVSLPETLRAIHVLGRRYEVELHSGRVMEKESSTEHHVSTTVTQSGPATVMGDQVFVPAPQIHTATTITRKDCLWVRAADGRESAWNFTNAALQARPGHVVSSVGRRRRDGSLEFLLACNHSTGQVDSFGGLGNAHQARRLSAWGATTFVGALGILLAMHHLLTSGGQSVDARTMLMQPGNWPYPLVIAGFVSSILVGLSALMLRRLRNATFKRRYLPAFRNFFEQSCPALMRQFVAR
jgi:hypothetical protein